MADIQNKFIFTTEGRYSLVSQLGGIKFAVLGAVLVSGLQPFKTGDEKVKFVNGKELDKSYKDLTLDDLSLNNGVVLGLDGVFYVSEDNQKVTYGDLEQYTQAYKNIKSHLLPVHYIPTAELKDSNSNIYGTYEFDLDKTTLAWDMMKDISFGQLILIGKQYAETSDATYNVAYTQKLVIVGIAQVDGEYDEDTGVFDGGIQLLAEQNEYISAKIKLRFTLDDNDNDITGEIDEELLDISKKISLVNNGLKTLSGVGVSIADGSDIVDEFNLNTEGSLAMSKTLMVAQTMNADELENEWNGVGLLHLVNRETDAENQQQSYKPQLILSTLQKPEDSEVDPVTAYNVAIELKGSQEIVNPDDDETTITTAPVFKISPKPETDDCAVDIFGLENKIYNGMTHDKMLFSKYNESEWQPAFELPGDNILIKSNYNKVEGGTNNLIFASNNNTVKNTAYTNTLITSNDNSIKDNASKNTIIVSDKNKLSGDTCSGNVIIGGADNEVYDSQNIAMINGSGLLASGHTNEQVIFGHYNSACSAALVYGVGTGPSDRKNALEFYPDTGKLKLYNNGQETITLGGTDGISVDGDMTLKAIKTDAITAANIYATSGFYIPSGTNQSSLADIIRTDNNIVFRIGSKIGTNSNRDMISYNTTDGTFKLYNLNDTYPAYSNSATMSLTKEYLAANERKGNSQTSGYYWTGLNGYYTTAGNSKIQFKKTSQADDPVVNFAIGSIKYNQDNTLKKLSEIDLVSEAGPSTIANRRPAIQFKSKKDTNDDLKTVRLYPEDIPSYHKIRVDLLVKCTDTGWEIPEDSIRIYGAGDVDKPRHDLFTKLNGIFYNIPIFCFCDFPRDTPKLTYGYLLRKELTNVSVDNIESFYSDFYNTAESKLKKYDTICVGDDKKLESGSSDSPTNIVFTTDFSSGQSELAWKINEFEINIFLPENVDNIAGGKLFYNWIPIVLSSSVDPTAGTWRENGSTIPIVKTNFYTVEKDVKVAFYRNTKFYDTFNTVFNTETDEREDFKTKTQLEVKTVKKDEPLHLTLVPSKVHDHVSEDPRLKYIKAFNGWMIS